MSQQKTVILSELTEEERREWICQKGCPKLGKSVEGNPVYHIITDITTSNTVNFTQLQEELATTKAQLQLLQEQLQTFLASTSR